MYQKKLLQLLRTFSEPEIKEFENFLRSPFHNKREELVPFYRVLCKWAPDYAIDPAGQQAAFSAAYPGKLFESKQLAYSMNYLLRLAEEFLTVSAFRSSGSDFELKRLELMADRGLALHYDYHLRKTKKSLYEGTLQESATYYRKHRLAEIEDKRFSQQDQRRFDPHIQQVSDMLDRFYYARKLRLLCDMAGRQRLFKQTYRLEMLDETLAVMEQSTLLSEPGIQAYYLVLKMLTDSDPQVFYIRVIALFEAGFAVFSPLDKKNILLHALNFCIRQIRDRPGNQFYMEEALRLYVFGIDNGILLEKGLLSPWHFKNVTRLAFNLKKLSWAESFIQDYSPKLPGNSGKNELYFSLAELNFHRANYDLALKNLNRLAFTDIHHQLNAKTLLIKIFYELGEEESMLSNLASFAVFLKRNNNISNELRKTYLNFCTLLQKVLRQNRKKLAALTHEVQNKTPLTDREWLLKILNGLNAKRIF